MSATRAFPWILSQLRFQLLVLLLVATMLPVAISLGQVREARRQAEGEAAATANHGAQLVAYQVADLINDVSAFGHILEQTPSFWTADDTERDRQLTTLVEAQPSFSALVYFTPDLHEHGLSNAAVTSAPLDLSSREYATDVAATHATTFGVPVAGERTHSTNLPVAIPLQPDGEPAAVGYLAAGLSVADLPGLWTSMPLPPGSTVMLVDGRDGSVLATTADSTDLVGTTLSPTNLAQLRQQGTSWVSSSGQSVLRTTLEVEGSPWYVAVDLDNTDIFGRFDSEAQRQILVALGVGALTFSALAWVWWRFASRVGALDDMAARWSRGDWRYRSGIRGSDELAQLASAFDTMAEQRLQAEGALRDSQSREAGNRRRADELQHQETEHLIAIIRAQSEVAQAELVPKTLMNMAVAQARHLTGAMGAAVATLEGDMLHYVAGSGAGVEIGARVPLDSSLSGECIRTGQVLLSLDTDNDPRVAAAVVARNNIRSLIVSPLKHRNRTVGVLAVMSERPRAFADRQVRAMELISGFLGAGLGHAEAFAERTRAETAAQAVAGQLTAVLRAATEVSIIGVDLEARIIFFSEGAERMLGYRAEEVIGKSPYLFHDPREIQSRVEESGDSLRDLFLGSAQWGEAHTREWTHIRKDGSRLTVMLTFTPLRLEDGTLAGFVSVGTDITERKAIDTMKDEFISIVSHEVRTPLTAVRGALGLLAGGLLGALPERATRMVDIALSNTERLNRLVSDMLDLERMQSGKTMLYVDECHLADVMRQAVDVMQPQAERAGIRLETSPLDVVLRADADRLMQVLTNLLNNAIKFSDSGTLVQVRAEQTDADHVQVDVIDHGRGIPSDQLEEVFERFRQVDASDSRAKGGSGLGLAICRMIVEQHGGKIWATSAAEGGTTLSFELPRQVAA